MHYSVAENVPQQILYFTLFFFQFMLKIIVPSFGNLLLEIKSYISELFFILCLQYQPIAL